MRVAEVCLAERASLDDVKPVVYAPGEALVLVEVAGHPPSECWVAFLYLKDLLHTDRVAPTCKENWRGVADDSDMPEHILSGRKALNNVAEVLDRGSRGKRRKQHSPNQRRLVHHAAVLDLPQRSESVVPHLVRAAVVVPWDDVDRDR